MLRDVIYKLLKTKKVHCGELFWLLLSCTHDGLACIKDPNKSSVNLSIYN